MLRLTTQAQEALSDALNKKDISDPEIAFRLRATRDNNTGKIRFGLVIDRAQDRDQVVEHNGRKVLLVEERISNRLDGITLKALHTPRGRRLKFQR
jgi:hypothetical protein